MCEHFIDTIMPLMLFISRPRNNRKEKTPDLKTSHAQQHLVPRCQPQRAHCAPSFMALVFFPMCLPLRWVTGDTPPLRKPPSVIRQMARSQINVRTACHSGGT